MAGDAATTHDLIHDRRVQRDRRTGRPRIHLPERRLGFDRRTDRSAGRRRRAYLAWIRRTSDSPGRTGLLMSAIVILAIGDIAFTFAALGRGLTEINPVMAALLDAGHGLAAVVKIGVTAGLAFAGWHFRRFRRVIEAGLLALGIMLLINLWHLLGILIAIGE